jgi:hypothetical protein
MAYQWSIKRNGAVVETGSCDKLPDAKSAAERAYVNAGMGSVIAAIQGPRKSLLLRPSQRGNSTINGASWR